MNGVAVDSTRTRQGAPWLKTTLVQTAWAASRKKDSYFHAQFLRLKSRCGPKKAILAVAAGSSAERARLASISSCPRRFIFAHPGGSRQGIIEGIGRGIGRVAVHEFMHQMLGASIADSDIDANSYEYGRPNRRSQYYGELGTAP
jgi:hypothetical protein